MLEYERAICDAGIPLTQLFAETGCPKQYDQYELLLDKSIPFDSSKHDRVSYVRRFSWAIPNGAAIACLARHAPILEVGCGSGYWAHEARKAGVDIVATDVENHAGYKFEREWVQIAVASAVRAIYDNPGRTLFMCWPHYKERWAADALRVYRGDRFIFVGESRGGCTGSKSFWNIVGRRWESEATVAIPQWVGVHDEMQVFKRRKPVNMTMTDAMEKFGGSFVKALGECFIRADQENRLRLLATFPEYVAKYKDIAAAHNAAVEEG